MNKKYIIGNWKALPNTWAEAESILDFLSEHLAEVPENASVVLCPPFIYLEEVAKLLQNSMLNGRVELGAQDLAVEDEPGQTGEVTGEQLSRIGVRYVIIGHSERRWKLNESDEIVNQKLKLALSHELIPIVCIGERERDENFKNFLKEQVLNTFAKLSSDEVARCFIAYEPVWAISTNPNSRPDTLQSALESIDIIKKTHLANGYSLMANHYLYGGSVNSKNAADFLKEKEINGVLVGGASVNKEEFVKILKQV